jgi:hypothetical protein
MQEVALRWVKYRNRVCVCVCVCCVFRVSLAWALIVLSYGEVWRLANRWLISATKEYCGHKSCEGYRGRWVCKLR